MVHLDNGILLSAKKINKLSSHEKAGSYLKHILWKKSIWKGYKLQKATILYDSNYMTFWNTQNYRDNEKMNGYQWLRGRKDESVGQRALSGQLKFSVWHYNGGYIVQTIGSTTPTLNLNATDGLYVILMCQHELIDWNQSVTPVEDKLIVDEVVHVPG